MYWTEHLLFLLSCTVETNNDICIACIGRSICHLCYLAPWKQITTYVLHVLDGASVISAILHRGNK